MARGMSEEERWNPDRFYAPQNTYIDITEEEVDEMGEYGVSPNAPAELTDIPTSSLNASRPRTVAAGYDASRKILTVVFRDGTVWNYSGVTEGEWQNFHSSISKGRPWINNQVFGVGEPADLTTLDAPIQASIYNAARRAQIQYKTVRKYKSATGRADTYRVGKTAQGKVSKTKVNRGGKNSPTANKPPKSK